MIYWYFNDQFVDPPVNWGAIPINAVWDDQGVQPSLDISGIQFVQSAFDFIMNHRRTGLQGGNGSLQAIKARAVLRDEGIELEVFNGIIDFTKEKTFAPKSVTVTLTSLNDIDSFESQIRGVTMALLESKNVFSSSDFISVPVVVEKISTGLERASLLMAIFQLRREIEDRIKELAQIVVDTIAIATGGGALVGIIASIVLNVARAALLVAYTIIMIRELINLITELVALILPPVKFYKTINLRTLLTKSSAYLGYDFRSSISELDNYYYLASRQGDGERKQTDAVNQLPQTNDFGYKVNELFTLMYRTFNSRPKIRNNVVEVESLANRQFWDQSSQFVFTDVLQEEFDDNISEAPRLIYSEFVNDDTDEYTTIDRRSIAAEIRTSLGNTPIDLRTDLLTQVEETQIPLALGSRKDRLNGIEVFVREFLRTFDALIRTFGGNSNTASAIDAREGMLKISGNNFEVAKLLYLQGGEIPENHREMLGAGYLIQNFHSQKSFAAFNNERQEVIKNFRFKMSTVDLAKVIENNYFYINGNKARFTSLEWRENTEVEAEVRINEPYCLNLQDEFTEVT